MDQTQKGGDDDGLSLFGMKVKVLFGAPFCSPRITRLMR